MAIDESAAGRRRSPRIPCRGEVWIGREGVFTKTTAQVRNLSRHGLFIEAADLRHPMDSVITIGFDLPDQDERIYATVVVRHARPDGIGVEFLEITASDQSRIEALIGARTLPPWWESSDGR